MRLSLGLVVIAGLTALITTIRRQLLVITVHGHSMEPALQPGDRVLIRRRGSLQRQQVVVFTHRSDSEGNEPVLLIKRVAAVAGDSIPPSVAAHTTSTVVPAGSVILLGDNPQHSFDSRDMGPVRDDQIVGVAVRRLTYPATRRRGPRPPGGADRLTLSTNRKPSEDAPASVRSAHLWPVKPGWECQINGGSDLVS